MWLVEGIWQIKMKSIHFFNAQLLVAHDGWWEVWKKGDFVVKDICKYGQYGGWTVVLLGEWWLLLA